MSNIFGTTFVGQTRLRFGMNRGTLVDLPAWSTAPIDEEAKLALLSLRKVSGLQGFEPKKAREAGFISCGMGSLRRPEDALGIARDGHAQALDCITLHVGTGLESDLEMNLLAESILDASQSQGIPLYVEIHRATVTQDIYRTVDWTRRFPELRFNADLSHWYTGLEMAYGDLTAKLRFSRSVLERVCFIHGRIGNNCCMQVAVFDRDSEAGYVRDFRTMWTTMFDAILRFSESPEYIWFMPELLPVSINYARTFLLPDGTLREESDRWNEAFVLIDIAQQCFDKAREEIRRVPLPSPSGETNGHPRVNVA